MDRGPVQLLEEGDASEYGKSAEGAREGAGRMAYGVWSCD
jgi:hypothetical protein